MNYTYISHKTFNISSDIEIQETEIENRNFYYFSNVFEDIDNINLILNNEYFYNDFNAIHDNIPFFQKSIELLDLKRLLIKVLNIRYDIKLNYNCYIIKGECKNNMSSLYPKLKLTDNFKGTIFYNNSYGLNLYKHKYINSIFANDLYFNKYDYEQTFLDHIFYNQFELVLNIPAIQNSMFIYPKDAFVLTDFGSDIINDRKTMEFLI